MPIIKRRILLNYNGRNHMIYNHENSDAKALTEAVHELERREGKVRGGLMKEFKDPESYVIQIL